MLSVYSFTSVHPFFCGVSVRALSFSLILSFFLSFASWLLVSSSAQDDKGNDFFLKWQAPAH